MGSAGILFVIALDIFHWQTSILAEGNPKLSNVYLIRSFLILISIIAVFLGLVGKKKPKLVLIDNDMYLARLSITVTLFISIIFLLLFIFQPSTFSNLSLEMGALEIIQFFLLVSCTTVFIISFLKCHRSSNISRVSKWSFVFLALIFFLIAMEEISWFQWIVKYQTPGIFEDNNQNEVNLHNFATEYFENIYYFGSFFFLVPIPFIRLLFPRFFNNKYLEFLVPSPFIGLIGAIACAYNFDMWNVVFIQMTFWSSIVILFVFFIFDNKPGEKYLILFTIVLMIITQVLFISNGKNFSRIWEVTEYKEFFIPLAFFIYSLDVFIRIKPKLQEGNAMANQQV